MVDDAAAISRLSGQLGYPVGEAHAARFLGETASSEDRVVLVYDDGEIRGWAGLAVVHALTSDPHVELMGLVVDADYRSLGIGAKIMAAAEAWGRARGLSRLRLRTNLKRVEAHRFYERLGYEPIKDQRVYEKGL